VVIVLQSMVLKPPKKVKMY